MNENEIELINNFINGNYNFNEINERNITYNNYNISIETLNELKINRLNYNEILDSLNNNQDYLKIYLELITNINRDKLYTSHTHGINHNIRTSLFALIISINEKLPLNDFKLVIEGAKYHDIGRRNDFEDKEHGYLSSQKLDFLNDTYSNEDMNYLKTIIECHSIDDKLFESIALKNGIKDIERCKKMFNILKDSDGLDRSRLGRYSLIKIKYIRTNTAKRLIPFAYELFENYSHNLEKERTR